MSNSSTLVHVLPGKMPERSVIEAIIKVYPTVSGFALQHEGELVCESSNPQQKIDEIFETMEIAKDGHRIFFFGNWPVFEDESDLQPYTMTDADGFNILALLYEGSFNGYSGTKGKHTDEYVVADEVIFPRLEKAYETADADFTKFIAELKSPTVIKTFTNTLKDRGWFAFLPYKGDPHFFGNNNSMKWFPWGSVSNGSNVFPEEKKEEAVVKPRLGFLNRTKATTTETPSVAPAPETKPVADPAPVLPVPEQPPVHNPETETKPIFSQVKVPPQLNEGVRNAWIRLFNGQLSQGLIGGEGELPGDHRSKNCVIPVHTSLLEFTKIPVSDSKSMKTLKEKVLKGMNPVHPATVVEFKESKSTVREPASNYTAMNITEDEANKTMEHLVQFLDAAAKKRPSPIEMQKLESKWPVFTERFGITLNELLLRSVEEIYNLFDKNKIATAAFIEMRRKYIEASGINLEEIAVGTKVENTEVTKTDDQKVPSSASESGNSEVKKSSLGFLNKNRKAS